MSLYTQYNNNMYLHISNPHEKYLRTKTKKLKSLFFEFHPNFDKLKKKIKFI